MLPGPIYVYLRELFPCRDFLLCAQKRSSSFGFGSSSATENSIAMLEMKSQPSRRGPKHTHFHLHSGAMSDLSPKLLGIRSVN